MSQKIIIEVNGSHVVHVMIPHWLFRYIAALYGFWIVFWAVIGLVGGWGVVALAFLGLGLGLIPIGLLFTYIYWRFFWWLTAAWMTFGTIFWAILLIPTLATGQVQFPGSAPIAVPQLPASNVLMLFVVLFVLLLLVMSLRRPANAAAAPEPYDPEPASKRPVPEPDTDDTVTPTQSFMERLLMQLKNQGYQTTADRDIVRVYKGRNLVGLVKCVDRPGKPVSPLLVKDIQRAGTAADVKSFYLATSGYFPNETKDEAARLGVQLMEVR